MNRLSFRESTDLKQFASAIYKGFANFFDCKCVALSLVETRNFINRFVIVYYERDTYKGAKATEKE